jgi:hypothetical protein
MRWDATTIELGIRWRPDADNVHAEISPTFNRIFAPSASGRERGARFKVRIFYMGGVDRITSWRVQFNSFLSAPHLPLLLKGPTERGMRTL